ncbi:MAG: hypothetical protein IJ420_06425, partial [Lachnospiraceae bacterium]|nr:hypothetical protein [Lachnospiraceae bacterium]
MKKKVNDILKGVAGAGIALGGAAAFGEMDVLYAAEIEQSDVEQDELESELDEYAHGTEMGTESVIDYASQSNSANDSTAGSQSTSTLESESAVKS